MLYCPTTSTPAPSLYYPIFCCQATWPHLENSDSFELANQREQRQVTVAKVEGQENDEIIGEGRFLGRN